MSVPRPPLRVALAESVSVLPRGPGLAYEPKFDGSPDTLRCLIRVSLRSRP